MADSLSFLLTVRDTSKRGLDSFARGLDKASQKGKSAGKSIGDGMNKAAEGANVMAAAAAAVGPAIVPMAAAAVPAIAGLGGAFAGAGAAAKLWGGVFSSTLEEVQEQAQSLETAQEKIDALGQAAKSAGARGDTEAQKKALEDQKKAQQAYRDELALLPPAQRAAVTEYQGMTSAWQGFVDRNKPATFGILSQGYGLIRSGLAAAQPLFDVTNQAVSRFLTGLQGWADAGGLKGLVDFLATNARTAFTNFQQIATNLATGLGPLFALTSGQGAGVLGWLTDMSEKLAAFGQGGGWERFLDYTSQNGPMLMTTLQSVATSLGTLAQAALPLAPVSLAIASGLTQIIAAIPPEALTALIGGFILYSSVMKAWTIGTLAAGAATKGWAGAQKVLNIAMRMNPIGLIITAVVLLGTALVVAYKKSETFRNIVNGAFRAVKNVAIGVFNGIKTAAKAVWGFITAAIRTYIGIWKTIITGYLSVVKGVWTTIKNVAKATWQGVTTAVRTAMTTAKNLIGTLRDKAKTVLDKIKALFSPSALVDAGKKLIQGLIDGISSKIGGAVDMVKGGLDKIKGMLPGSPIKHGPLKPWNRGAAGKKLMALLTLGVRKATPAYVKTMSRALDAKTNGAKAAVRPGDTSANAIQNARKNVLKAKVGAHTSAARDAAATLRPTKKKAGGGGSGGSGSAGGSGLTIVISGTHLSTPEQVAKAVVAGMREAKANGFSIPVGTFQGG